MILLMSLALTLAAVLLFSLPFGIPIAAAANDPATLRLWQITLRPLLSLLEIALLFGGFLVALLGRDRLTLHDLLLGTRVVKSARA